MRFSLRAGYMTIKKMAAPLQAKNHLCSCRFEPRVTIKAFVLLAQVMQLLYCQYAVKIALCCCHCTGVVTT